MAKIRVAIAGVGNCASALIQGCYYYQDVDENSDHVPGLMHNVLGGYKISDIEFVAAFDVDKRKVGKDLSEAIFTEPNCAMKFCDVPELGVEVKKGPILDGIASTTKDSFLVDDKQEVCDVASVLKESKADILINYLPVGSEKATRFYAEACLKAGVGFINAIPVFIASDPTWSKKFEENGLPVLGDDIKSQVGATIVHRALAKLFCDRGVKLERTYQINVGGNTDFLNMMERSRLKSKKISKTMAVQSILDKELEDENIHIGPSDYIPWLKDKKIAFIRLEGRKFGDAPISIELRLEVEDSPNSAGVMVDAIRCMKIALDRKISGPLISASAYFMKHPPKQYPDSVAKEMVEKFVRGEIER
ncbi:MAG TPA: inositol-3-phosphate synthase [Candidatus Altiarchaeales archaeon]|nr:inositol-3-phosphate synthase [Candidatus Altiarchaeales archaeon]